MSATFVLSPGRCGTQWLAHSFSQHLTYHAVTHEPLNFNNAPMDNSPSSPTQLNPELLFNHLEYIKEQIARIGHYIECGFPCWRHLEWFKHMLNCPVKVIYIHRAPTTNAASLLKLNAFVSPFGPHLSEKELFNPFSPDALLPEYQDSWQQLSPFEKCLYYWTEVNLQAEQYHQNWRQEDWFSIPFERLFEPRTYYKLLEWLGAEQQSVEQQPQLSTHVDSFYTPGILSMPYDPTELERHAKFKAMAQKLGY